MDSDMICRVPKMQSGKRDRIQQAPEATTIEKFAEQSPLGLRGTEAVLQVSPIFGRGTTPLLEPVDLYLSGYHRRTSK